MIVSNEDKETEIMNILYIAFSCNPYQGSEDKVGWQIPFESAKTNQVYVITIEQQRPFIERYLEEHPQENLRFFYVDIPNILKRVYKGSFRLNAWHRAALPVAKEICKKHDISIIHQITPVEFRAVGDYGTIPDIKFVCGPIAGGQSIPKELIPYIGPHVIKEWIRSAINAWFRLRYRLTGKLKNCDYLLFANEETRDYLIKAVEEKQRYGMLSDVAAEICNDSAQREPRSKDHKMCFLTVARLIYLKGHSFLLDALAQIPKDVKYRFVIVGEGPERQALEEKCAALDLTQRVTFTGNIPHQEIGKCYEEADVFVFPSLREATGTVLAEAISHGLAVVTLNKFGGKLFLDDSVGWLLDGDSKEAYIEGLKNALISCICQPEEVARRGANAKVRAREFSWEKKMQQYQQIYDDLTK